jgi:hypothetical protein
MAPACQSDPTGRFVGERRRGRAQSCGMTGAGTAGGATERAIRWERARLRHLDVLTTAGMVPGRAARRLKYACLAPAGLLPWAVAVAGVLAYLAWISARGDFGGGEVVRAVLLGVAFVVLSTTRASVTEHGLSFDVAGLRRPSSFGFVPLHAVGAVVPGTRPEDWPRGPWYGGPWPGLGRVHVRYQDVHGTDRVRSAWVRDPGRYAETVLGGRPERRPRGRPGRRR